MNREGKIHSIETCGTVDGPGLRTVIFLQGCPLKCIYCHNPDTWLLNDGKSTTSEEIFKEIIKYKSYMYFSNGGVTLSGGEPLLQPDFCTEIIEKCKTEDIHTAVDTSGCIFNEKTKKVLSACDLVLLDIKAGDDKTYKKITTHTIEALLKTIAFLNEIQKPVWVKHVVVPNVTDEESHLKNILKLLKSINKLERFELLPFHKMGEYKWENLKIEYSLGQTKAPTPAQMEQISTFFQKNGVNAQ